MNVWLNVAVMVALALPAVAQDRPPADPAPLPPAALPADGEGQLPPGTEAPGVDADIGAVIGAQLNAFRARDAQGAWRYASQNIQRMFGSPSQFGLMVQQLYPMIWDNSDARYVSQRPQDGYVFQQVMIQDPQGRLHMLEYAMIKTPGGWRIDGVSILPAPDVGT